MATAKNHTNTGRMMIVALLIATFALLTFLLLDRLFRRLVAWVPNLEETDQGLTRIAGAAAAAGPIAQDGGERGRDDQP